MSEEQLSPRILYLGETVSTNLYLREYLQKETLPEGSVVVAEYQSAGRGQPGNHWESAPGENLLFSVVLYPGCIPAGRQFIIAQIAALSVKETLDRYTGDITIKWPNDIYWKDMKISGMLIENDLSGATICRSVTGIGLNLNQLSFTSDAPNPVSLRQITGNKYDKNELLNHFLRTFYDYYLLILQEQEELIRARYRQSLYRKEGFYPYRDENGLFRAEIDAVEPTGHLILRLSGGERRRYAFKEVSFEKP